MRAFLHLMVSGLLLISAPALAQAPQLERPAELAPATKEAVAPAKSVKEAVAPLKAVKEAVAPLNDEPAEPAEAEATAGQKAEANAEEAAPPADEPGRQVVVPTPPPQPPGAKAGEAPIVPVAPVVAPAEATGATLAETLMSMEGLQKVGLGLLVLLFGWMVSKAVSWLVFKALCKTDLDDKIAEKLGIGDMLQDPKDPNRLERWTASVVHWTLMILVVLAGLDMAGFKEVAQPIQSFINTITSALPLLLKAIGILVGSFVIGKVLQKIVSTGLNRFRVDDRVAELSRTPDDAVEESTDKPFSEATGTTVFWIVMLVGLAGAAEALGISSVSEPVRNALVVVVEKLPAIGVSALILVGGYVLGRIARAVAQNVLDAAGFNKLITRIRLEQLFGKRKPGEVVGLLAHLFIVLQALIASLNTLGLETLSQPLTDMMGEFWGILPQLAVSVVMLAIGVIIGRILRGVVSAMLGNLGFDKLMETMGFGKLSENESYERPSQIAGVAVQAVVVLMAVVQVLDNLELSAWSVYVNDLLSYSLKNVGVSAVILTVGLSVANVVRKLLLARTDAEPETMRGLATLAHGGVLVVSVTMALRHLDVAEDFVLMTFALLFGALCLATALAFGLGAREVASEIVRSQYDRARQRFEGGDASEGGEDETEVAEGD